MINSKEYKSWLEAGQQKTFEERLLKVFFEAKDLKGDIIWYDDTTTVYEEIVYLYHEYDRER